MRISLPMIVVVILISGPSQLWAEAPSATSPDGKRVASADDKTLTMTENQKLVWKTLAHKSAITAVAFSPDGKRLVSADKDGKLNMMDAATGKQLLSLSTLVGANKVSFSADGRTLEVKSPTVTKKYDTATGKEQK